jgi:hypothetical protein
MRVSICAARVGPLRRARRSPAAPWCECKGTRYTKSRTPNGGVCKYRRRQNRVEDSDGPEQQKISWQMLLIAHGIYISPLHDNDTRIMQTRPIKCAPDNSLFIRGWRSGGDETAEENKWARGSFCYWWCYSTSDFILPGNAVRSALKSDKIDKRLL